MDNRTAFTAHKYAVEKSMITPDVSKQAQRDKLQSDVDAFLNGGGIIEQVESGIDDMNKRIPETTASYIF